MKATNPKPDEVKIFTTAQLPPGMEQAWLQHIRDFDVGHPGCHFEMAVEAPHHSLAEVMTMLRLDPELTFTNVFTRKVAEPK